MKNVLLLDVETTGLDPATDQVIEVGAILYSLEHATSLISYSTLVHAETNAAEHINRIPVNALVTKGVAPNLAWGMIGNLAEWSDAILAHYAEFERSFSPPPLLTVKPWICTKSDIRWPKEHRPEMSLIPLTLAHDLGVVTAHRALADCDMLARLLTRCHELGHDVTAMLERGLRPKVTLIANVSYDDRELAKQAGFRWNAETKQWLRQMVEEDAQDLGFPVTVVEN